MNKPDDTLERYPHLATDYHTQMPNTHYEAVSAYKQLQYRCMERGNVTADETVYIKACRQRWGISTEEATAIINDIADILGYNKEICCPIELAIDSVTEVYPGQLSTLVFAVKNTSQRILTDLYIDIKGQPDDANVHLSNLPIGHRQILALQYHCPEQQGTQHIFTRLSVRTSDGHLAFITPTPIILTQQFNQQGSLKIKAEKGAKIRMRGENSLSDRQHIEIELAEGADGYLFDDKLSAPSSITHTPSLKGLSELSQPIVLSLTADNKRMRELHSLAAKKHPLLTRKPSLVTGIRFSPTFDTPSQIPEIEILNSSCAIFGRRHQGFSTGDFSLHQSESGNDNHFSRCHFQIQMTDQKLMITSFKQGISLNNQMLIAGQPHPLTTSELTLLGLADYHVKVLAAPAEAIPSSVQNIPIRNSSMACNVLPETLQAFCAAPGPALQQQYYLAQHQWGRQPQQDEPAAVIFKRSSTQGKGNLFHAMLRRPITLGSDMADAIRLPFSQALSCQLIPTENGFWLDTPHTVTLNGERLSGRIPLCLGDHLQLANVSLTLSALHPPFHIPG